MLASPIAKEQLGLSLRLRGGGAPDSKGKGAQKHRSAAVAAAPSRAERRSIPLIIGAAWRSERGAEAPENAATAATIDSTAAM